MSVFLYNFMIMLLMLISVAFLTLFERKLLSYAQFRKGPNKVGILGILQPFSDAIKLFMKENLILMKINKIMYFSNPMMGFLLSLMGWLYLFSNFYEYMFMEFGILLMVSLMMVSSYTVMFSGWSSNSNYSMLGAIRGLSQSLSYEISFFLIIFILIILVEGFELSKFYIFQYKMSFMFFIFPLFLMFYLSIVAELNRSPFDLMEGESELVSGFNTEYMSASFALIFLGEYSFIILYNYLMILLFLGLKMIFMFIMLIFMNSVIIILRSICPRIRYDQLMYMCWLKILPLSLFYMIFVINLKIF